MKIFKVRPNVNVSKPFYNLRFETVKIETGKFTDDIITYIQLFIPVFHDIFNFFRDETSKD